MKHKVKYAVMAMIAGSLLGCETTLQLEKEYAIDGKYIQVSEIISEGNIRPSEQITENITSDSVSQSRIEELRKTIEDDFQKQKMLIDLDCKGDMLDIDVRTLSLIEPPQYPSQELEQMKEDADRVINDISVRLENNPDESLVLAYTQEIARLKLEYKAANIKAWQTEIESMKHQKLEEIDKASSSQFECNMRYAENESERNRMLYVAEMGEQATINFDATLDKLSNQLEEIIAELDNVNNEAFDGILF
ncbi:hypothetical protein [Photobacterium galatheae]|uniref:Lipoprotein n=1 Tax=Photobacterium galatheae TaxID=1654360 RepID=A0A066RP05_9GAMM|nr:hypothetical protein [Photobacterium galatheae]KDM90846.1 hypothetical protein EA58_13885 [Photobacterium galatheae]MCM0149186.1 hypothetical protein [Photobacterium galatheae]